MRSGTTRAQQRMMAKLFSARSGIDVFPLSLMDRWAEPPPWKPFVLISPS